MQTQTNNTVQPAASAAVVVTHEVEDYANWKRAFDAHASARRSAGVTAAHVNRNAENPNLLHVYLAAKSADALSAFMANDDVKATMKSAGVKGAVQVAAITPVEDLTVKDKALAGAIVKHRVADYAAWKQAFDGHAQARASAGIVGHAVNRASNDPNLVVIYLQAASIDSLKAFAGSADLKETMQRAGVQGAPEITFVQGSTWTN
jgi:hypothetical protein